MRKIFIDCGYYRGFAMDIFRKQSICDSSFEFFAFEASKITRILPGVNYINKAVWISDGFLTFRASPRRAGKANSIFKNRLASNEDLFSVESIDFSKWIMDNFSKEDIIYLKMDIEGAEYEVLNKMIDDGSISYINTAYIEWHRTRRPDIPKVVFSELQQKINDTKIINLGPIERIKF